MTDAFSLYAITSSDGGATWPPQEEAVCLAPAASLCEPTVETDARGLSYVFWQQSINGRERVVCRRSPSLSAGWLPPETLALGTGNSYKPRLAVDARSTLHLVTLGDENEVTTLYSHWGPQLLSDREGATAFNQQRHVSTTVTSPLDRTLGIVYEDNGVVYYLRSGNTRRAWSLPETVDFGEYPALVTDEGSWPKVAYLKNGNVMVAVRQVWPEWQHYQLFEASPPYVWAGAPAPCYAAFPGGTTVRVAYSVHVRPGGEGPPTENYIYLSELFSGQVLPPEVIYSSTPDLCLTPTVGYTPEFPSDRLHLAWEAEGGVLYSERIDGVWTEPVRASDTLSEPAWSPALETYGDKVYCVWRGPSNLGGEPGDAWLGDHKIPEPLHVWGRRNRSVSANLASEYPVQTTLGLGTVWQEQTVSGEWDIWMRHGEDPPRPLFQSPSQSAFPHCALDFLEESAHYNTIWTEQLADGVHEVRFLRKRYAPSSIDPALYSVATGEDEPSSYCLNRDSAFAWRDARADFGRSGLRYRLPWLAPAQSYSAKIRLLNPTRATVVCTVSVDGSRLFAVRLPADSAASGWFDLPARLYRDDGMVVLNLRSANSGVALAELTVSETARRPAGGGIQSVEPIAAENGLQLEARPGIASGRFSLSLVLAAPAPVRLSVHDMAGREVARLSDGLLAAGRQAWTWDGTGFDGRRLPAGVYYCRATAAGEVVTARLVLVH